MIDPRAVATHVFAALAGLLLVAAGVQTIRLSMEESAHQHTKRVHAEQMATLEANARQAEATAREEEQRRTAEVQRAADEAHDQLHRARADAAAAADAGQRLRAQLAAITAGCGRGTGNPGASKGRPPADATADLLANVQRRLDEAAGGIARHADEARTAGVTCERSYDAVRSPADSAPLNR